MDSINNNNILDEKLLINNKANCTTLNKFRSDKALPYIFCNKYNKSLITGINICSEISTKYSSSGVKEKNLKIKRRIGIGINFSDKLNPENLDKIYDNKIKAFKRWKDYYLMIIMLV